MRCNRRDPNDRAYGHDAIAPAVEACVPDALSARLRGLGSLAALVGLAISATACGPEQGAEGGIVHAGNDVIGANRMIELSENVPGDAMLAAGEIRFGGSTGGDYLGAGGRQTVTGVIGGSVRAAGGTVELDARVIRNATIAGGDVLIGDGADIGGSAYFAGGTVRVDGTVGGALRVGAGDVHLDGPIGGDVRVEAGRLEIGPGASIAGNLVYRVNEEENLAIDPAARITGRITALPPRPESRFPRLAQTIMLLGFLLAGILTVLLFPGTVEAAAETLRLNPGFSFGIGLLWVFTIPVAAAIIGITVIGLPLAFIAGLLYLISLYLGRVVPALWIGNAILGHRRSPGRGGDVFAFLIGGVALVFAQLIPWIGFLVLLVATILGVGAFALRTWGGVDAIPVDATAAGG